jgi:hypothetical protein
VSLARRRRSPQTESASFSEQEAQGDASISALTVLQAHDGSEKFSVGGHVAEWKRKNQPHPDKIVGHARGEIEAVAIEVDHLADVLELSESSVKRADVRGKRNFQTFPDTAVARCLLRYSHGAIEWRGYPCCHLRFLECRSSARFSLLRRTAEGHGTGVPRLKTCNDRVTGGAGWRMRERGGFRGRGTTRSVP